MSAAVNTAQAISTVRPRSGRQETLTISAVFLGILIVAGVAISQRQVANPLPRLYDWQLSAFYDLSKTDQAIHTSLVTAIPELWLLHADMLSLQKRGKSKETWPDIKQLAEYYYVAPFAQDLFWTQNGSVKWTRVTAFSFEGSTVYHGYAGTADRQSAYLVVLSHAHKGATFNSVGNIWMHPNPNAPAPNTVVRDSLIRSGWKQVVPYSGEIERKRIRS